MRIFTRHIGSKNGNASSSIEVTFEGFSQSLTEDVTDLRGEVSDDLIISLRELADELEEQNLRLNQI